MWDRAIATRVCQIVSMAARVCTAAIRRACREKEYEKMRELLWRASVADAAESGARGAVAAQCATLCATLWRAAPLRDTARFTSPAQNVFSRLS